jgi:hypothetical protein
VTLSAQQSQSLRAELDALRREYTARIGARDAEYIRTVRAVARISRVAGRLLIHFSLEPVSWSAGVVALATYKALENMEIGHNVLHGQYDFMRDPELSSATSCGRSRRRKRRSACAIRSSRSSRTTSAGRSDCRGIMPGAQGPRAL